jgi:hypothetical protein
MKTRLYCAVLLSLILISACSYALEAGVPQQLFSVSDSISMTRFNRPAETESNNHPDVSPDRRYLTVVTSRGILRSNQIESTIWLIKADAVRRFVDGDKTGPAKEEMPRPIATIAAVPDIPTFDSYGAVITDLKWSEDSSKLYFLGSDAHASRRMYEINVRTGKTKPITPVGLGVRQYTIVGSQIAFTAIRSEDEHADHPWLEAAAINQGAGTVTGLGLDEILYPDTGQGDGNGRTFADLWIGSNGRFRHVPDVAPKPTLDVEHYANPLAVSPDRHRVLRLLPIEKADPSWSVYDTKPGFESWRIDPNDASVTSPFYQWRLREYMLVDTKTGKMEPLVRGPHGSSLAEEDASVAVWSKDGTRILVGNVALPMTRGNPEENRRRIHVCALAAVDLPSFQIRCIAFTRDATTVIPSDTPRPLRLQNASFGVSKNDVIANFAWHGRWGQTERYQLRGDVWKLVETVPGDPISGEPLNHLQPKCDGVTLAVKQDLNTPPTLWTSFHGKSRLLWNPNPQLGQMKFGRASLFHWKDTTAYDWEGVLVLPVDYSPGKRYPLVIQTHGYLGSAFVTDGLYPTAMAARPLSSAGFVVLQTDNRPDHFVSPQEALNAIDGWDSAIETLDAEGIIDKKRVGIIGFSRTCWYVEEALIRHPGLFSAATIADGIDNSYMSYRLFAEARPTMAKEYEKIIGAKPVGEGLRTWIDAAPGFHLDQVQTPLRIEAIGPASMLGEWEIYASLRALSKPVDLIYIPAGQHILQKPLDRLASQQGNVDWFRFWLQSYEEPIPAKANQYTRWESMRNGEGKVAGRD